jgi:multicomponent K+:H+ antiporter subunit E
MKRLLPSPWLSLGLLGGWLLLTRSFSIGQVLLGLAVAVVMPLLMAPCGPRPGPLRRWGVLVRLILRVGRDVLCSAAQVVPACCAREGRAHRAAPSSSCRWSCATCMRSRRWR